MLRYCRMIATASKHGGLRLMPGDPNDLLAYVSPPISARWKIEVRGKITLAVMIFEDAFTFWNTFIREHGIADENVGEFAPLVPMPTT